MLKSCGGCPLKPEFVKGIGDKNGEKFLAKEIHKADKAHNLQMEADRTSFNADGVDLAFVTIRVFDEDENLVPNADNLIEFEVMGNGKLAGVDNGNPVSHRSMKGNLLEAMNCYFLAVIQASESAANIQIKEVSKGL